MDIEDERQKIADTAIRKLEKLPGSLSDFAEGLDHVIQELRDRRQAVEEELS